MEFPAAQKWVDVFDLDKHHVAYASASRLQDALAYLKEMKSVTSRFILDHSNVSHDIKETIRILELARDVQKSCVTAVKDKGASFAKHFGALLGEISMPQTGQSLSLSLNVNMAYNLAEHFLTQAVLSTSARMEATQALADLSMAIVDHIHARDLSEDYGGYAWKRAESAVSLYHDLSSLQRLESAERGDETLKKAFDIAARYQIGTKRAFVLDVKKNLGVTCNF